MSSAEFVVMKPAALHTVKCGDRIMRGQNYKGASADKVIVSRFSYRAIA